MQVHLMLVSLLLTARPQTGYRRGLHVFSVTWPATERGTHAVVGVATR